MYTIHTRQSTLPPPSSHDRIPYPLHLTQRHTLRPRRLCRRHLPHSRHGTLRPLLPPHLSPGSTPTIPLPRPLRRPRRPGPDPRPRSEPPLSTLDIAHFDRALPNSAPPSRTPPSTWADENGDWLRKILYLGLCQHATSCGACPHLHRIFISPRRLPGSQNYSGGDHYARSELTLRCLDEVTDARYGSIASPSEPALPGGGKICRGGSPAKSSKWIVSSPQTTIRWLSSHSTLRTGCWPV